MDALPVGRTKASESNANCSALSRNGEHELVRGRGASENIELAFSNPLYAEPEREVTCAIYESVSGSVFFGILQLVCYTLDTCTFW